MDELDNCPDVRNEQQWDCDGDGVGDACDVEDDADGDGVADACDNCPDDDNVDQLDSDRGFLPDPEVAGGGLTPSGYRSTWEFGTPINGPGAVFGRAWATDLAAAVSVTSVSHLDLPPITIALGSTATVSWRHFLDQNDNNTNATLEVSVDGGEFSALQSFRGSSEGVQAVDVEGQVGERVVFRFAYIAGSADFAGWYLDDVAVSIDGKPPGAEDGGDACDVD